MRANLVLTMLEGEFHVDLYTLPDNLIGELWNFTKDHLPSR